MRETDDFISAQIDPDPIFTPIRSILGQEYKLAVHYAYSTLDPLNSIYVVKVTPVPIPGKSYETLQPIKIHVSGSVDISRVVNKAMQLMEKRLRTKVRIKRIGGMDALRKALSAHRDQIFCVEENASAAGLCDLGVAGFKQHLGVTSSEVTFGQALDASKVDERALFPAIIAFDAMLNAA